MYEQYMGVIKALGFQFTPAEWGRCNGAIIDISQFTALFSLLGCRFGGDCRTTFNLPDLRGRIPMGWGQSPGLTPRVMGTMPGLYQEVLSLSKMPEHLHSFSYTGGSGAGSGISLNMHVATNSGGKKQTPAVGDYVAPPADNFGSIQNNMFAAPADVTTKATIGGVIAAGDVQFDNTRLTIANTPQATQAVEIQQPTQAVHYSICMSGIYPSRS
ncbi:phage tail protein [Kordiimonas lacus]|uniref:Microcystin-dependent protein n=1 Tax=Kordiimonas lacus TaxID=637679 RepID=A0A1G6SZK7_9PROT|nr:tail fiber protein [Kordiimonas lacus]SDD22064.1 Microcystin-dependent protein [Kordiimonas lacus]